MDFDRFSSYWDELFKSIVRTPRQNHNDFLIKLYEDYLISENLYQDYLDIFKGENTRKNRKLPARFKLPYPHAFIDESGKYIIDNGTKIESPPKIKYVLLGEAAPELQISSLDDSGGDKKNSYFYNIRHLKSTQYYTAILKAFKINSKEKENIERKRDCLFQLACKGVVLKDLFPFAVKYHTKERVYLNNNGKTADALNIAKAEILQNNLIENNVHVALVAPPTISHFLAQLLNRDIDNLNSNSTFIIKKGPNKFGGVLCERAYKKYFYQWPSIGNLNDIFADPNPTLVPIFCCCCYSGAGTVPHELFIRNALNLGNET